ncbi:MAG: hypothetical protein OEL54_03395 [Flavobacteriaceae bacterium]|nr:hypothetical protein [Flavobacteriaceae bacterium]
MNFFCKILILFFISLFISCSDDSGDNLPLTIAPNNVEGILINGTWKITSYMDDDKNETNDYTGYIFTFMTDKTVNVSGGRSSSGFWNTFKDDKIVKFNLNFENQIPLDELNDDWIIKLLTVRKIELEDVSGGNGSIDKLTFEKN